MADRSGASSATGGPEAERGRGRQEWTASAILSQEATYDILVGDFGRDASVEYLGLVAARERHFIEEVLRAEGLEFYDEYRRIMYTAINDVAYLKRAQIEKAARVGQLTDAILVGLGSTPILPEFLERVSLMAVQEALNALDRGHRRLRFAVLCNGLSEISETISDLIRSTENLTSLGRSHGLRLHGVKRLLDADIAVHTIPDAVLSRIAADREPQRADVKLLVLGTRGVNALYERAGRVRGIDILLVNDAEQDYIDKAIISSIIGDPVEIFRAQSALREQVVIPKSEVGGAGFEVVEACTDFHLGLGRRSLEIFAEHMVEDCYRPSGLSK